jgi:hypothetical protein
MKIRFYCDVPPFYIEGWNYFAYTKPVASSLSSGWRRIAFDVDMPVDVLRQQDEIVPATFGGEAKE